MAETSTRSLDEQRAEFAANRFLAMPIAGTIAWAGIGVCGAFLPVDLASWALFLGTGSIFWLGVLVGKFTGEDLLRKGGPTNAFDGLFFHTILMAWLVFAIAIPFFLIEPTSLPLTVGILAGLMWIPFSWIIQHWIGLFHGIARTVLVLAAWYLFPEHRFVVIPMVIVAIYLVTIYVLLTRPLRLRGTAVAVGLLVAFASGTGVAAEERQVSRVPSKDGTLIAVECAGSGPTLLIVHGGMGDRSRWTPMFPLLSGVTACAMDRRGRGDSGDSPEYSLAKEAEDIAAVVESRPGTVFVLGHSYGGLCALEATFLTNRITKLLLYEPPLRDSDDGAVVGRIEELIRAGRRDQAVETFLREVVNVSPAELEAMRSRPEWASLVESIDSHPRQMRALSSYRFDTKRIGTIRIPTLLIRGGDTAIPDTQRAMESLKASLPSWTEAVLKGQKHYAMVTGREQLAAAIHGFLTGAPER